MVKSLSIFFVLLLLLSCACTSKSQSELSKALTVAVKENKISKEKMEDILIEYELLRENEKEKARKYADQIVKALEMGADSSHIDVVRKQVSANLKKV